MEYTKDLIDTGAAGALSFEAACYIAAINTRLGPNQAHTLIKWCKEIEHYEPIMLTDNEMHLVEGIITTAFCYIMLRHHERANSHKLYLYREALSLISHNCTNQIQQEILSWMNKYLEAYYATQRE